MFFAESSKHKRPQRCCLGFEADSTRIARHGQETLSPSAEACKRHSLTVLALAHFSVCGCVIKVVIETSGMPNRLLFEEETVSAVDTNHTWLSMKHSCGTREVGKGVGNMGTHNSPVKTHTLVVPIKHVNKQCRLDTVEMLSTTIQNHVVDA
jgi:hypothetical protein